MASRPRSRAARCRTSRAGCWPSPPRASPRRARATGYRQDETCFLDTLMEIAESGVTPAEELLALYHGRWNGSVDPVFRDFAY